MLMTWYVAITNPNCHRRAENGLAELGYRAFWPKLRKWASHARVKVAKEYPVLGRYLFVEIPDGNFWKVRNVNGIEAILTGDNGAPAIVPERIVSAFRERYMSGEWDFVAQQAIPSGARIKLMEGEFADMLAVIRRKHRGKLEFVMNGKFHYTHESNVRAA
jgi:transcription antitermination factor NusG